MEDLLELESDDTYASRDVASKIQCRLKGTRDPSLLADLVEFYFQTYSKRARKVLTTLREMHSQDFFDILNNSICSRKILPVFKLLAHALNSQTSWLYRIVDHPLFTSILQQLEESEDVMVLSMGVLVMAAILPLVPTYIDNHIQQLFGIFCDLAIIRTTKRLGLTPNELILHLDVSVYYLFLQLYALFPCNLFSFFKKYCTNSTRAQVNGFQEFIAPLFDQVQLHPGLVTDSCAYELSKAKWRAMEPSDIATHSIQFCMDALLTSSSSSTNLGGGATGVGGAGSRDHLATPTISQVSLIRPSTLPLDSTPTPSSVPRLQLSTLPTTRSTTHTTVTNSQLSISSSSATTKQDSTDFSLDKTPEVPALGPMNSTPSNSASSNPQGLKTSEELEQFWSPSVTLGQIPTPNQSHSETASHRSSRNSMSHYSQPNQQYSSLSSPDSTLSSTLHTPAPLLPLGVSGGMFSFNNYSPTASVDGESLFGRQGMSQSAVHTPSRLDESLSSAQVDVLSQSMRAESAAPGETGSPLREHTSFRNRLGKIFGMFKKESEASEADTSEDYIELFTNDDARKKGGARAKGASEMEVESVRAESRPQGTMALEIRDRSSSPSLGSADDSGKSDSPVNSHRRCEVEGGTGAGPNKIDLPPSNRTSRSDSNSSQSSVHHFNFRINDSPNTAGAGNFGTLDLFHSYTEVGASASSENTCMSSSYPRSAVSSVLKARKRTSNSETEISTHAHQLQEKLQRLVEHKEPGESVEESGEGTSMLDSQTPVIENSVLIDTQQSVEACSVHTPSHAHLNRLPMKRVSVCSRKGLGLRFTSESSSGGGGTITDNQSDPSSEPVSMLTGHPSPLALLDQFVSCGEVLHRGSLSSIPLTEQEGVNWNHFGGCPHSEEFRIMQSQVVLLHSQLLFERHQCVQHARRNRRLLSKARSAAHITEELVALRDQLHQQEALVSSLQQQLRKVTDSQSSKQQLLGREEGGLLHHNASLKDSNTRMTEQLFRMKEKNEKLEEELKLSTENFCKLSNQRRQLEPRIQQASQLEADMAVLARKYHKLQELYQQEKGRVVSLQSQSRQGWEWQARCLSLQRENEEDRKRLHALELGLGACQGRLKETEEECARKQQKLDKLHLQFEEERGRAWCKMKSLEEKYGSMKVIGQQLECHVMELKSRTPLQRRKSHTKHRRNASSTSSTSHGTTSSPVPFIFPASALGITPTSLEATPTPLAPIVT